MTNIEKAKALIGTFASGNTDLAKSLLKENYIQHNLAYGTGRESFLGSAAYLGSAPIKTTIKTVRAYEDNDKVVLHSVYNFAGMANKLPLIFLDLKMDLLLNIGITLLIKQPKNQVDTLKLMTQQISNQTRIQKQREKLLQSSCMM